RDCDCYSLSGGLADREFGAWSKSIAPQESFAAPTAYLSACRGTLSQVCQQITAMFDRAVNQQPAIEQTLPILYNDWGAVWGHPSRAYALRIAQRIAGTPVRYLVVDAGWTVTNNDNLGQGGNGDWVCNTQLFPGGMRALSQRLAQQNIVLGIWYELEVTTRGARAYEKDFDAMHVQRGGKVVVTGDERSFWDFCNPDTVAYLHEKVTRYLQDNEIGYLKVDYNGNIGSGCDGAESDGEGLRQQMQAVRAFFIELRRRLPQLVIENCASGGHRLEPSMMQITAMSNFSDAHECREIPILAADLHALILPRQSLIWAVLSPCLSVQEIEYRVAACCLGRMCLSGKMDELSAQQWLSVQRGMAFYEQAKAVVKTGTTTRFGQWGDNRHHPHGIQGVLRVNSHQALLVCHAFASPPQKSL
ncbi:MAG: alpha-galactosidase, partial [Ruthenibacterium sp.]